MKPVRIDAELYIDAAKVRKVYLDDDAENKNADVYLVYDDGTEDYVTSYPYAEDISEVYFEFKAFVEKMWS